MPGGAEEQPKDTMDEDKHQKETEIMELKREKATSKARFTRARNRLLDSLEEDTSRKDLKTNLDRVEEAMDIAIESINALADHHKTHQETDEMVKVMKEVEIIEKQYDEMIISYRSEMSETSSQHSETMEKEGKDAKVKTTTIEKDMRQQLKRVEIPVFDGTRPNYESWKAAFLACVDAAPATAEYKLLNLRQYLKGQALRAIEDLGHSKEAYEAAKERLDRKFGGERRRIGRYMERIENFPVINMKNKNSIEQFADLLDIAVINIKEAGLESELRNGTMYFLLQKKMPKLMLTNYHRWVNENSREESVQTLKDYIVREAEYSTIACETIDGIGSMNVKETNSIRPNVERTFYQASNKAKSCRICNGDHYVSNCQEFLKYDVPKRWDVARAEKLCYRCLGEGHSGYKCRRSRRCGLEGCRQFHARPLHTKISRQNTPEIRRMDSDRTNVTMVSNDNTHIALRTVPVVLKGREKSIRVNALLDDASTQTYINTDIASELGLVGEIKTVAVNMLNGNCRSFETMPVSMKLESIDGNTEVLINALTTNRVTGNMKPVDWTEQAKYFPHLNGISFPKVNPHRPIVDILIGSDHPEVHRCITEIYGRPGEPYARLGPLGWTCIGKLFEQHEESYATFFAQDDITAEMLRGFWEVERSGTEKILEPVLSPLDQRVMRETEQSLTFRDNRYAVAIPWRNKDGPELPNNYKMALDRLERTERKLNKSPEIKREYQATIDKYVDNGYISKVDIETDEAPMPWYLPHFPVVKPDRETTKVRIVFDASAKLKSESLNDKIYEGPKLQNDLFGVLQRFRKHPVAIVSDISEMYLQIALKEEDRQFHRFLWNCEEGKPTVYQFNRLVFGINCSPFLAQFVARKNAEIHQNQYPLAVESVEKSTYMDDTMDSVENDEEGIRLYLELAALWNRAGMYAKKWLSNSKAVLEQIPEEDRAREVNLEAGELPTKKTLGVVWQSDQDTFTFRVESEPLPENISKRMVLKIIARLFDPIGFVSPCIVQGKILMQQMWLDSYDWDDKIADELKQKVQCWFNKLSELNNVKVRRSLNFSSDVVSSSIHVFVDASEVAYCAVVYVRHELTDSSVDIRFVCSKTKVAPLQSTSIPRLELMAAVLGLRLVITVVQSLQLEMKQVVFWTDSVNVLWWIHRESRSFKSFVANRVGEIHEHSLPSQWRHVPTKENPADVGSRGLAADKLVQCTQWWIGPDFLHRSAEEWPVRKVTATEVARAEQRKSSTHTEVSSAYYIADAGEDRLQPERYSSWLKLTRVLAWVFRFIENCRTKVDKCKQNELQTDEIKNAETVLIHGAQMECYPEEHKLLSKGKAVGKTNKLAPLNPVVDENELIRCNSRLKYAEFLSYDAKYPIVLPRKSHVTKLIVKHFHEQNSHSGTNHVLSALSSRYWIEAAREEIREWENECCYCKRMKSKPATQIMAPLPSSRLNMPIRAFSHTAVDFGGPFFTIQGRGKCREKRYLCLFTCLGCRAVHLEMAYGLDTNSFMNAFYRFVSRRGLPVKMNSDNGTNFVAADRELKELVQLLDSDQIVRQTADKGIQWDFNPPAAPHFGGVHESMIKSGKRAISRILQKADVRDEELLTAFVGAEGLLNSRPLTYQSSNAADNTVLTPNHFLHGQAGGQFAPSSVDNTTFNPQKRWRYIQELVKNIWHRWLREFLPTLSARKKWFQTKRDFEVGDVVMVIDPETHRGHWPLGRILEVFPGRDGHVRVVSVRVGKTVLRRPVSRLCFLEHSD